MAEQQNSLGSTLYETERETLRDEERKTDWAGKKIIQQKIIAGHILAALIPEFEGKSAEWIAANSFERQPGKPEVSFEKGQDFGVVPGLATEMLGPAGSTAAPDFRFAALAPRHGTSDPEEILISVDIQNDYTPGYPLENRQIFYEADAVQIQKISSEAENYRKLKKTYCIWICTRPPQKLENKIEFINPRQGDSRLCRRGRNWRTTD